MAQVHDNGVCRMIVLSISLCLFSCLTHLLLSPYDSLSLSLNFPVHTFVPFSGHAHLRTRSEKFGYLAKSALNTQKEEKYTSILDRWHNDEVYRASQVAIGWTETYAKYLDYISEIDISYNATYRQRVRHNNTVYMRGVDSNKLAGPLCQRPGYKSPAQALVSHQQAQGKVVPRIPMKEQTRQSDTLDPAVRQHLEWLSFHCPEYFSSFSSST